MIKSIIKLRESEEGFTLIELMIVMVVLGVLAGIVIFAVGGFQDSANNAKTEANDRICDTANAAWDAKTAGSTLTWASLFSDTPPSQCASPS